MSFSRTNSNHDRKIISRVGYFTLSFLTNNRIPFDPSTIYSGMYSNIYDFRTSGSHSTENQPQNTRPSGTGSHVNSHDWQRPRDSVKFISVDAAKSPSVSDIYLISSHNEVFHESVRFNMKGRCFPLISTSFMSNSCTKTIICQ